ncbi:hypothetical protein GQ43DRAFT_13596 [Delitschia confertaspora ATCC 74209]|uniref:Uncharacterized protein n=1 Tax=Delitschia confertaspora ATCC 74209 TaxID=1513339 RepID=A0A9P4JM89_9PLEO|nr:hypothetical protein GQ43DRAFT_13596 [Delitschia confertaspora ATCC 74209]
MGGSNAVVVVGTFQSSLFPESWLLVRKYWLVSTVPVVGAYLVSGIVTHMIVVTVMCTSVVVFTVAVEPYGQVWSSVALWLLMERCSLGRLVRVRRRNYRARVI